MARAAPAPPFPPAPMLEPFTLPFVQRGVVEILLLAIGGGLLGTWIVLRGLAFYTHGVATATFPGLVLAGGVGFPAPLGAFAVAVLFALAAGRATSGSARTPEHDSITAMLLVAALAIGVVLASDVFGSGAKIGSLLFGSLLVISPTDLVLAGTMSSLVLVATVVLGSRWLARGFDHEGAPALGLRSPVADAILLGLVALAAVATLSALGALLASALLVVPAATTRLWIRRMPGWQAATTALVAVEGVAGLWLSVRTNAPPGAAVAVLAGCVFALSAVARGLVPGLRRGRRGSGRPLQVASRAEGGS